jgi:predicted metal-dependent hydrolase
MRTKSSHVTVDGLQIEVIRKDIKHLHLRIYPPDGHIRVSAPRRARDRDVRAFVRAKKDWISLHLDRLRAKPDESAPKYESGETHLYQGRPYQLRVIVRNARPRVTLRGKGIIEMTVPLFTDPLFRQQVLAEWYRARLKEAMPALVAKWQAIAAVDVAEWRVKRMRTRWGSCNPQARRIWVNLELAKRPVRCLEYVIVHEMVHLLERRHNARFYSLLDEFFPGWREVRAELNEAPPG